jgi:hypothetical protein
MAEIDLTATEQVTEPILYDDATCVPSESKTDTRSKEQGHVTEEGRSDDYEACRL